MGRATRAEVFYDIARTVCGTCHQRCEGRIVFVDDAVWLDKWCPEHGRDRVMIADDVDYWRMARERWLKPAELPAKFGTEMRWGCPWDCGLCPDHQQHSCLSIVEITDQCNLSCPVCYAASGPHRPGFRTLAQVEAMLDTVVRAEGTPDVVQISGGEPTLHPELFAILDAAKARPIRHIMLNTNGLRIAREPEFARRLATYAPGFEVYLQFDSLRDAVTEQLRGARLVDLHRRALENLEAAGVSTTLVMTVAQGVNDDEIGAVVEHALTWKCVRGVTLQPVQQAGRTDGFERGKHRLTLTGVRRRLLDQTSIFRPDDVVPVPCHPDALAMAYALRVEGQVVPLTGMIPPDVLLAGPENTIVFERIPGARDVVNRVFSTAHSPESAASCLSDLLCCVPRVDAGALSYENVFRVLIVRFADAHDLDVRSLKKSCIHFATPDGKMIPFETYNLFYRDQADGVLARGRALAEAGR